MRAALQTATVVMALLVGGCLGNNTPAGGAAAPPSPVQNKLTVSVDTGPAADPMQINHAYVTVTICVPGSSTQCATVDHVLLDTASNGLRLVRSVLAAKNLTLSAELDAQGRSIEECVAFGGGQTWGPVVLADVALAGETALKLPLQILDDTHAGAPPPATCGSNGTLLNDVGGFNANGLLGVGVMTEDCGNGCVNAAAALPIYYGCDAGGACTAENLALTAQVANPVSRFAADNNGVIVDLPALQNANGDPQVLGELIFGIDTQTDNAMPATGLTVLAADAAGDFRTTYNGGTTLLPALIDSGTEAYAFDDPSMASCVASGGTPTAFNVAGFYCPAVAPQSVFAVNTPPPGVNGPSDTVNFAIADPHTFVAGASAFGSLGGGKGASNFIWGMPFFYGRKIYLGIDQRPSGSYVGPYYAY